MRCFNHPDVEAVGSCKTCCKGLCRTCAVDLGHGLSCRDHQARVELLNTLIERNSTIQSMNTKGRFLMPAFYGFMGLAFLIYGFAHRGGSSLSLALGGGFVVFAVIVLTINLKAFRS